MSGRTVKASDIEKAVAKICLEANTVLREDVLAALEEAYRGSEKESGPAAMLEVLVENAKIAKKTKLPICQDTGMAAVFVELGRDVVVSDGNIFQAIDAGVEKAYKEGFFRKSVVADPILRDNTGTNTPAMVHIDPVEGDKITISVMPKGFGSENKSAIAMLNPTSTPKDIIDFCVGTVKKAGPDACPPYVLGIGIGGTMEMCAFLAKKALLRPIDKANAKSHIAKLEEEIKVGANELKIGTMGLGGDHTVIGVNIETAPTHIAGLPVAVNISCHALRSASITI